MSDEKRSMKISFTMPDGTEVVFVGDPTFSLSNYDIAVPETGDYQYTYTTGSFTLRFTRSKMQRMHQFGQYKPWPLAIFKRWHKYR